jgi:N-acetylglucosaminyl-diphospho-decaprenol L-rhamnosyltransferase
MNVACILVHHRKYPAVISTIARLIECGIDVTQLLVYDNTEDDRIAAALKASVPLGTSVLVGPNSGYAAAVNAGIRYISENWPTVPDLVLVTTHEVMPEDDALRLLTRAISTTEADVVGPTLLDSKRDGAVWSQGGYLSRFLNIPKHFRSISPESSEWVRRDWLDGAFCLYRFETLQNRPMDEDYFLYFEEVDYHLQLQRVYWVPGAIVFQESSGIPPRLLTRNLMILGTKRGRRRRAFLATAYVAARSVLVQAARGKDLRIGALWSGAVAGSRYAPTSSSARH